MWTGSSGPCLPARNGAGRRGRQRLGGGEAVAHHRAGVPGPAVGADPGRGDVLGGYPDRDAGAEDRERTAVRRDVVVIARRLSTIRDADIIRVMEAGQLVEQGTHTSLLEAGGA